MFHYVQSYLESELLDNEAINAATMKPDIRDQVPVPHTVGGSARKLASLAGHATCSQCVQAGHVLEGHDNGTSPEVT